ncbi:MAG: patatin-like phospholipase family protein [Bacteroidia bacterium]
MKHKKIGIVLSGGGARGFAHIGVLKALNENEIFPGMISAVSAGSIVGCLYADGKTPDEIFTVFSHLDLFKFLRFYRPKFGMLKAEGIKKLLVNNLSVKNLEELKIPLSVCATNFSKARTDYFNTGSIVDSVLASSAIPMLLKPYLINGNMYVDGGLMNNLPVEPLEGKCDLIIGVNVNSVHEVTRFRSFRNYTDRVLHLALRANVNKNIPKCDIYIEPPNLMDFHLLKVSLAREIFEAGYNHTLKLIDEINKKVH